ncbi:MAG: RNA-binding S4 domain-containing protein [Hyphomicrobiaceae bacterium]|nr:RNA-binding S4 domain-containing protein [Hyphomicrobiaceae bacterium]
MDAEATEPAGTCRLDKWLWHVRLVKTRTSASELVADGYVRVNANRVDRPGYALKPGDVVLVVLRQGSRTFKVVGFAERRGDAEAAAKLYEDLAPPPPRDHKPSEPVAAADGHRERGTGRPTKRDRRLLERFKFRST